MQDNHTQLLVHKSHQEMIFQVAQYNPMAGDMRFDKTLEQIMSRIYRPGIQGRCVPVVGTLSVSRSSSDFVPFTFNADPWAHRSCLARSQFVGVIIITHKLYELLGIKSFGTSVYHPHIDGLVEQLNNTMIRSFIAG